MDDLNQQRLRLSLSNRLSSNKDRGFPDLGGTTLSNFKRAAVLVPIVGYAGSPMIILTKRSETLLHHPGQISFPGGRVEPGDGDSANTALRETDEEIGVKKDRIDVLGKLPDYDVLSGFRVTPIVGWLSPPLVYVIDSLEVDEVFEIPLQFVLDPNNHKLGSRLIKGERKSFYVISYEDRYIWGATAGILVSLYHAINDSISK